MQHSIISEREREVLDVIEVLEPCKLFKMNVNWNTKHWAILICEVKFTANLIKFTPFN